MMDTRYIKDYIKQLNERVKVYNDCMDIITDVEEIEKGVYKHPLDALVIDIQNIYKVYKNYTNNLGERNIHVYRIIDKGLLMAESTVKLTVSNIAHDLKHSTEFIMNSCPKHTLNLIKNELVRLSDYNNSYDPINDFLTNKDYTDNNKEAVEVLYENLIDIKKDLIKFANCLRMPVIIDEMKHSNHLINDDELKEDDE